MKILVPIKRVADPANANRIKVSADGAKVTTDGLEWKINSFDVYAIETALRLNENGATNESLGEVVVVCVGPDEAQQTIRVELGRGAERGIHIKAADEELDSMVVAKALKAVIDAEQPDLVLMGKQTVDSESNATGQMLAELLGWPMATSAMSLEVQDGGKAVKVGRETEDGVLTLKAALPAVVTCDTRIVAATHVKNGVTPDGFEYKSTGDDGRTPSLKGIMGAKKKTIDVKSLADLGVTSAPTVKFTKFALPAGRSGTATFVNSVDELVSKLKNEAKVL